jgi:hypothetical protein
VRGYPHGNSGVERPDIQIFHAGAAVEKVESGPCASAAARRRDSYSGRPPGLVKNAWSSSATAVSLRRCFQLASPAIAVIVARSHQHRPWLQLRIIIAFGPTGKR